MRIAKSKVHFIGIGGIGMCGLAELLHNMRAKVSGSDMADNMQVRRLREMGIPVFVGHSADHVQGADVVVYSSAVKPDNVEYQAARELKIPLIARAEALAELMHLKRGLAIAGTHGKTTTTSMVASVFLQANADPTIVVGGRVDRIQSTAQLGQGEWLIAEADESDGSFTRLSPEVVIVTNIDNDHLDHYKSFENLQKAFVSFASRIPFYGAAIVCGDDPRLREVFAEFSKKIIFYGFDESNDYVLRGSVGEYEIWHEGGKLGRLQVPLPGRHNALNALAAVISGLQAGLPLSACLNGIAGFKGVDRRFQFKGKAQGIDFYDDYGHHPTEIKAALQGFKERFPRRRVVVLFQPHRYSRTQLCWDEFLTSFDLADELYVMDIYPAGEPSIEGIDAQRLAREIKKTGTSYIGSAVEAKQTLAKQLKEADVLVTLGAGDVWRIGESLLKEKSQ